MAPTRPSKTWPSFLLLLATALRVVDGGCPRKCECLWRSAKITVDCSRQGLSAVPREVEAQTQVLNISGNHIQAFTSRQFLKFGLTNLQRVAAAGVGLAQVDDNALKGLTNLVELDLSDNLLNEIPSGTLNSDAASLMSLSLRANVLTVVRSRAFHRLSLLQRLDLSDCQIRTVEIGAFQGLGNLQRVHLHGNRLAHIHANDIPPSLHGISLHANNWECDCNLRGFRTWLTQSNVPRPVEPICHGPRRLLEIKVSSLALTEFACAPQLSPTSMYLTVPSGKNVSIVCRVASDPPSDINWFFDGRRIAEDYLVHNVPAPAAAARDRNGDRIPGLNDWSADLPPSFPSSPADQSSPIILSPYDIQRRQHELHRDRSRRRHQRVVRRDEVGDGETRSELLIHNTSLEDNGTYHCEATNKAASAVSNFTLHVTSIVDAPEILQLRLEYFVAASILVLVFLVLVLVAMALLLLRLCRKRIGNKQRRAALAMPNNGIDNGPAKASPPMTTLSASKVAPVATRMPKHIQMGTGFATTVAATTTTSSAPPSSTVGSDRPDLLTDHSLNRSSESSTSSKHAGANLNGTISSESSRISSGSGSNVGSYQMAMENIIDDYRKTSKPSNSQLIGSATVLPRRLQQGQHSQRPGSGGDGLYVSNLRPDQALQNPAEAASPRLNNQQEFLIGSYAAENYGLPSMNLVQQQQQLQTDSLGRRHPTLIPNSYGTLPLQQQQQQCQQQHFPHSLDPIQLAQLQQHHQQLLAQQPHYFLTIQRPPGLSRNRHQVLPDEKYPSPEPSFAGSSPASSHLYQSLPHQQAVPVLPPDGAVFAFPSLQQQQQAMPQVPLTTTAPFNPADGVMKGAKREVGVGTSAERRGDSAQTAAKATAATLVNMGKEAGEPKTSKGDPETQMGNKRGEQKLRQKSAIGTGPLSGLSVTRNDNDDGSQESGARGAGRRGEMEGVAAPFLMAPLAEMEGTSSLESSSTLAGASSSSSSSGGNGAGNQSESRKSKKSPSAQPRNSHQSTGEERLSDPPAPPPREDDSSIRRDALTAGEARDGRGRVMGANERRSGGEGEEDLRSRSEADAATCTTAVAEEGEETEEDLEAVGDRVIQIYKELDDAFSSLDKDDNAVTG